MLSPVVGGNALAHDAAGDRHELQIEIFDAERVDFFAHLADQVVAAIGAGECLVVGFRHVASPSVLVLRQVRAAPPPLPLPTRGRDYSIYAPLPLVGRGRGGGAPSNTPNLVLSSTETGCSTQGAISPRRSARSGTARAAAIFRRKSPARRACRRRSSCSRGSSRR